MNETIIGILVILAVLAVLYLGRERIHAAFTARGIKPAVGDTFIAALAMVAYQWIANGDLDVDGLRLAVGLLILGAIGVAAPPDANTVMRQGGVRHR